MKLEIQSNYCSFNVNLDWPEENETLASSTYLDLPNGNPGLLELYEHHKKTRIKLGVTDGRICGHRLYSWKEPDSKTSNPEQKIEISDNFALLYRR